MMANMHENAQDSHMVVQYPPLNFFYAHFHNAIKSELESLAKWVVSLEQAAQDGGALLPKLVELQERYRFLEQVYKYHSSVEDEVVYPALDAKVKNVTVAYRVEHQDEELLLEQLAHLISAAMTQGGADQTETIRGLVCKMEEIHRTLKKHLAKEEEQLLPLLLQHFAFAEQAGLVAQFLYCIPLTMVERVLAWLKPQVPQVEQEQLLYHIRGVVPDDLLVQLLTSWLQSPGAADEPVDSTDYKQPLPIGQLVPVTTTTTKQLVRLDTSAMSLTRCTSPAFGHGAILLQQGALKSTATQLMAAAAAATMPAARHAMAPCGEDCPQQQGLHTGSKPLILAPCSRPPIKEIIHIHRTICCALEEFAMEARGLQQRSDVTALQLGSLVERHRFLRSVCMFHTISEEEVMYPEVRRLSATDPDGPVAGAQAHAACSACEQEHESEVSAMEDLGRLLADVRAFARRGRKEVTQMLTRLSSSAEQVLSSISRHMAREEAEVFPLLERHLCVHRQRAMVWRTLTAMPLRLLERVLPWVTATLSEKDTLELLNNIKLGSPEPGSALVKLLLRWAERGRIGLAGGASDGAAEAGKPGLVEDYAAGGQLGLLPIAPGSFVRLPSGSVQAAVGVVVLQDGGVQPLQKRQRITQPDSQCTSALTGKQEGVNGSVQVQAMGSGGSGTGRRRSFDGQPWPAQDCMAQHAGSSPEPSGTAFAGDAGTYSLAHRASFGMAGTSTSLSLTEHQVSRGCSPIGNSTSLCPHMETSHGTHAPSILAPTPTQGVTTATALGITGRGSPRLPGMVASEPRNAFHPIDHIFQFHQALRQELKQLEADALRVEQAVMAYMTEPATLSPAVSGDSQGAQKQGASNAPGPAPQNTQFTEAAEPVGSCMPENMGARSHHSAHGSDPSTHAAGADTATGSGKCVTSGACAAAATRPGMQEQGIAAAVPQLSVANMQGKVEDAGYAGMSPYQYMQLNGAQGADSPGQMSGGMAAAPASYVNRLPKRVGAALQTLDGRFQFLWGIYRAHSRSEDEIVFPALESKQALRNVSHAYTLDHQQEEQLFLDLEQVLDALRRCDGSLREARESVLAVRRMCAAVRASLETHIRAEEAELWPLFTEHFSLEEQQYLVGVIIGRTGAQVLQALVPWISESFSLEEKELMMGSLRQATKNTMFDQWLEAISHQPTAVAAVPDDEQPDTTTPAAAPMPGHALPDPELARFLTDNGAAHAATVTAGAMPAGMGCLPASAVVGVGNEVSKQVQLAPADGTEGELGHGEGSETESKALPGEEDSTPAATVESSMFRPGWEDIFRMNQKQLEAAVMRVSADPHLEPGRKAYLIQNIMVSKYIVAQQKRMKRELQEAEAADGAGGSGGVRELEGMPGVAAGNEAEGAAVRVRSRRTYHDAVHGVLGCKHYQRKAQLVAPCCQRIFTCRLCHDEAVSHRMDRYAVNNMVCMECGVQQPVAESCNTCATKLARYYCNICHLFDDEPGRHIYHCPFCNVCRRGRGLGIDFFHCMSCNACMSLSLFKSHTCRERAMESNCPVCSEYLFDSADPIKELPCGHLLHSRCFAEYTRYNYTCPLCSKSVGDMSVYFQMLDSLLASERLPSEYAGRMQQILCNDCGKSGFARFHFAYHACPHCRSYNTRIM